MENMVKVSHVRKVFGPIVAVDNVSFTVGQGEVLGFLGPNGAGKSTTMKIITGFLTPTSGSVKVKGYDIQENPIEAKRGIGYLPEGGPLYQDMTPLSFLSFIAEIRGFRGQSLQQRVADTIKKMNLGGVVDQRIDTLSKGFKRRVGLAQAILHDPSVLILDEPTDGLDPNQKHEVRALIRAMAKEKAIILSTHILEEVQAVCTRAIIIAKGKVITDGTPAELEARSRFHNAVTLKVKVQIATDVFDVLQGLPGVSLVETLEEKEGVQEFRVIPVQGQTILTVINRCSSDRNWGLVELSVDRGQLDDVFRSLTVQTQAVT